MEAEEENGFTLLDPISSRATSPIHLDSRSVLYDSTTESLSVVGINHSDNGMKHTKCSDVDDTYSTDTDDHSKVLLDNSEEENRHPCSARCLKCCPAYRSADPNTRVTPFAVVLLSVLLLIYILNQADRLVLPVAIPSGLRCAISVKNECRNLTNVALPQPEKILRPNESVVSLKNYFSGSENGTNVTDCIHFNDNEQGLLTGPAFTVIYVVAGLPLARLADTRSRPIVLLIGLLFWSAMVILTGFTVAFWQLLLLRIFLGIGEAACNPVAYSLLADFYPARHRAFALSIYHYGVYVGGAMGWMVGYINEILGWRWTFRILGALGFTVAPVAMLALWEPKMVREKRTSRMAGKRVYSIWEVTVFLGKSPPYWLLLIAGSTRNISGYALGAWLPTFFVRRYGLTPSDFSIPVGLVVLFGGGLGCFLGGFISDRLSMRWKNAKAYVIAVSQVLAVPCIVGVLLAPRPEISYGLLFLAYVTAETWLGPAAAIVQDLCMPTMRAQASAIYIGIITIIASIGPVIIPGIMNHASFLDPCTNGVGYSLLITVPTFYLISAGLFAILGFVILCWDRRTDTKQLPYAEMTNEKEVPHLSP